MNEKGNKNGRQEDEWKRKRKDRMGKEEETRDTNDRNGENQCMGRPKTGKKQEKQTE